MNVDRLSEDAAKTLQVVEFRWGRKKHMQELVVDLGAAKTAGT